MSPLSERYIAEKAREIARQCSELRAKAKLHERRTASLLLLLYIVLNVTVALLDGSRLVASVPQTLGILR